MRFDLRDYQQECVDTIIDKFQEINTQIVQLPTGAGKTVILWHFLKKMNKRALILAPTRELIEQLYITGSDIVGYEKIFLKDTSYWPQEIPQYTIMTTQAATWLLKNNKIDEIAPDYLIVDEAHRSQAKNLKKVIENFGRKAKVLGLTATPERLDGKNLLEIYKELTFSRNLLDLIREKYLVDLKCFRIETKHTIEEVKFSGGDLAPSVLKYLDVSTRNEMILDVFMESCKNKKTLIFCLNIEHSKKIARLLSEKGISAKAVYGAMPRRDRYAILSDFRAGEVQVLCNCQLLTEGFDMPSIEAVMLARPTKSKALYCQMIGRGVRPYKGKEYCYVYDFNDEIHNICSFNILGNIRPEFEFMRGESLLEATERFKVELKDIDFEWVEHDFFDGTSDIAALPHQISWLEIAGVPILCTLSLKQAAYLIWKTKEMENYGFDYKAYWRQWQTCLQSDG